MAATSKDQIFVELILEAAKTLSNLAKLSIAFVAVQKVAQKVQQVFKAGMELAKLGAAADQAEKAFSTMAKHIGADADKVLADLTKMSGGTISQMDLMASASRAALFNIPMGKMSDLMEIARASALGTGKSIQQMFDDIVLGIARGSPMILDNLGLTIKVEEATTNYAKSIGKAAEELTAEERKQAMLNAVLEAGGATIAKVNGLTDELTAAQKWEKYEATVKDLRIEVGKYLQPAFVSVVEQSTKLAESLAEIVRLRNAMREVREGTAGVGEKLMVVNHQIEQMQMNLTRRQEGGGYYEQQLEALGKQRDALIAEKYWTDQLTHAQNQQTKAAAEAKAKEAAAVTARAEALQKYLGEVADAYAKTPEGQRAALESSIAYWEGHLSSARSTAPEIQAILKMLREELTELTDVTKTAQTTQWEWISVTDDVNVALQEQYDLLQQQKSGVTRTVDATWEWIDVTDDLNVALQEEYERLLKIKEATDESDKKLKEYEKSASKAVRAVEPFADAIGMMAIDSKKGWDMFKDAAQDAIASVLKMLAEKAFIYAAEKWAEVLGGNLAMIPAALAWSTAGASALVAAGVVKAMAEGGVVTKPTMALIGERGPEAVVPLNKAGGFSQPNIIVHVHGTVMEEEGLARRIGSIVARQQRGY